jgi:hypothetical protein
MIDTTRVAALAKAESSASTPWRAPAWTCGRFTCDIPHTPPATDMKTRPLLSSFPARVSAIGKRRTANRTGPSPLLQSGDHHLRQAGKIEAQVVVVHGMVDSTVRPGGALRALGQFLIAALGVFHVGLRPQCTRQSTSLHHLRPTSPDERPPTPAAHLSGGPPST